MPLWAKLDVDTPNDGKLLGQPVTTRHLWTCLICLAKKQDNHGAIEGYDCSLLAGSFNIPRKAVASALTHFQAVHMIELDPDGTIRLLNFTKHQGEITIEEQRESWAKRQRDRQQRKREAITREHDDGSRVTPPEDHATDHASREEKSREDQEQETTLAKVPAEPPPESLEKLAEGWPKDLLERVHLALSSTRVSGSMSEGVWRGFLKRAMSFTPEIRIRAASEYLDHAYAADGKSEAYLVGIMRNESARSARRQGAGHLQLSPSLATQTPGRKVL